MRLPSSSFLRSVRRATAAPVAALTALQQASGLAGDAECQQVGSDVLQQFVTEADSSLKRLKLSLKGGMAAWGKILEAGLESITLAAGAIAIRSMREALSAASSYALEFATRKAYALSAVVDMLMGIPEAFEQAMLAEAHNRALVHIEAFRSAVNALSGKVDIVRTALELARPGSEEDGVPYHMFDFDNALKDLRLAETLLAQERPAPQQAQTMVDRALAGIATGTAGNASEADLQSLFRVFSSQEAAQAFFTLPGSSVIDLVRQGVEQRVIAPIEAAYAAVGEMPELIEKAADEYGKALEWIERLRTAEHIVSLTRRSLSGARTNFFVARALQRIRRVISEIDVFDDEQRTAVEGIEFRFSTATTLFQIRAEMTALSGQNTEALQSIRETAPGELAPGQRPRLFEVRGQKGVSRMETVLRLLMASVGRSSGQVERARGVLRLLDEAGVLATEAIAQLGPAPPLPPVWSNVRMLMREAGIEQPIDEIFSGRFATRAIDAYEALGSIWTTANDIGAAGRRIPNLPCAPPVLNGAPAMAERAVGFRIARERTDQLRALTSLDALDASRRVTEARVYALDRIMGLVAPESPLT